MSQRTQAKKSSTPIIAASASHLLAWAATFFLLLWPYAYQGVRSTPEGGERISASLIEINGLWIVGLLLVPVIISGVGMFAALLRDALGRWTRPVLWACAILVLAFSLLAILSIGSFYLPAALAMVAGAATMRR